MLAIVILLAVFCTMLFIVNEINIIEKDELSYELLKVEAKNEYLQAYLKLKGLDVNCTHEKTDDL